MRDLNYELKQMCRRNRDGSYATQRDRERVLDLVAGQLQELGYRHMAAASTVGANAACRGGQQKDLGTRREWCPVSLVVSATLRRSGRTETLT